MADDSELDYIRTFLGKVHTAATVKQIEEAGNLNLINDTQKMLVMPGELLTTNYNTYKKRYKVQLSETTEATLTTALTNIIAGIDKLNRRQAIASYTKPSSLVGMELVNSTKAYCNIQTKRYDVDIYLDVEWSVN